jgi:DNA-binding response OmpR family regulator
MSNYAAMTRKRILFVDHRPEHLRQPVLRLQLEGYDVDEAQSGKAGLEALGERPYDLLILDAELPEEDGWGVLRAVHADASLSELKVIVFMAPKGETGMLVLIPVDAELRRPFSMGALLAAVRQVVGPA